MPRNAPPKIAQPQQGQLPLQLPRPRGGARPGAGRKPKGKQAGVRHGQRAALAARHPVHVTLRLCRGLPRLRTRREYAALRAAFTAGRHGAATRGARGDFRLCHYAVLNDHLHFVVEADDRAALSRGLQGLLIRVAKTLNKLWQRRGTVFADRYHEHVLKTPREVRNAIRYVLNNGHHHAAEGSVVVSHDIDLFSSAPWFDGFVESVTVRGLEHVPRPTTAARTWLLQKGWRKHGLLSGRERAAAG